MILRHAPVWGPLGPSPHNYLGVRMRFTCRILWGPRSMRLRLLKGRRACLRGSVPTYDLRLPAWAGSQEPSPGAARSPPSLQTSGSSLHCSSLFPLVHRKPDTLNAWARISHTHTHIHLETSETTNDIRPLHLWAFSVFYYVIMTFIFNYKWYMLY